MPATLEITSPSPVKPPRRGSWFRPSFRFGHILEWMAHGVGMGCLAGLLLRITFQDRIPRLATLFYMTPLVVLAIGMLGVATVYWFRGRNHFAKLALILATLCGGWWATSCVYLRAQPSETPKTTVLLWNTQRGAGGWPGVAKFIRTHDAPLIGLVESAQHLAERQEFWIKEFADRNVVTFRQQMALITQYEILSQEQGELCPGSFYARVDLQLETQPVTVFLVDIQSKAWGTHRPAALKSLEERIASVTENPVIVMGDFNTPTDSVFFDSWRRSMRNAFEESGRGESATWPTPFPVLALDHIWLTNGAHSLTTRHLTSSCSDHQAVSSELTF